MRTRMLKIISSLILHIELRVANYNVHHTGKHRTKIGGTVNGPKAQRLF